MRRPPSDTGPETVAVRVPHSRHFFGNPWRLSGIDGQSRTSSKNSRFVVWPGNIRLAWLFALSCGFLFRCIHPDASVAWPKQNQCLRAR